MLFLTNLIFKSLTLIKLIYIGSNVFTIKMLSLQFFLKKCPARGLHNLEPWSNCNSPVAV